MLAVTSLAAVSSFAHGGPPSTQDILFGTSDLALVTTHGLFTEETDWSWTCEEAISKERATQVVRTPSGWFVATVTGLRKSKDGCLWESEPNLFDHNILVIQKDVANPEHIWAATLEGLWLVSHENPAELMYPADFSVRHFRQGRDGTFLIIGFDESVPIAQLGEARIVLPTETGRMEVVTEDEQGRFYVRFPSSELDRLVRVSVTGAEVLIPRTELIRDVITHHSQIYVLYRSGVSWSADDGRSWSPPRGEPLECLRKQDKAFFACPPYKADAALFYSTELPQDPASWTWNSLVGFNQMGKNECAKDMLTRQMCDLLWPVVREELRSTEPEIEEIVPIPMPAPVSEGNCGATAIPSFSFWLSLLGYRRLRSKTLLKRAD